MGFFGNKRNIRRAKEAAGQMQAAGIRGMEIAGTEQARTMAAEATKFNVLSALGTEGTYGPGATGTGGGGGRGLSSGIYDTSGEGLSGVDQSLGAYGNWANLQEMGIRREGWAYTANQEEMLEDRSVRKGIIDPEKYTAEISKSPLYQMQSFQVAEAKQLLEREGPLWERLENSTLGVIYEGAALQLRDTQRRLKNAYAKGGSARNAALNEYNSILAAERSMQMRTNESWQANLKLNEYVQTNFERVRDGSMRFVDSLPGLNANYRDAMMSAARLSIETTKTAAIIAGDAFDLRMSQQKVDFASNFTEGLLQILGSTASSMGSAAMGGATGGASMAAGGGGGGGGGGPSGIKWGGGQGWGGGSLASSGSGGGLGGMAASAAGGLLKSAGGAALEGILGLFGGPQTSVTSERY